MQLSEHLAEQRLGIEDAIGLFGQHLERHGYHRLVGWFACWCAWQVAHLASDPRSVHAIRTAQRCIRGSATAAANELNKAKWAANDAMWSADRSKFAARASAWALAREVSKFCWGHSDRLWGAASSASYAALEASVWDESLANGVAAAKQRAMMVRIVRRIERNGLKDLYLEKVASKLGLAYEEVLRRHREGDQEILRARSECRAMYFDETYGPLRWRGVWSFSKE